MAVVADQRVTHVGTFNANPVCASAAVAAIGELERSADSRYPRLESAGARLAEMLRAEAGASGLNLVVNQVGAAAYGFVSAGPVDTYADTLRTDVAGYRRFARALLEEGVHVIPRGLLYVSSAHDEADLEVTREAIRRAAARMASGG
jgi:glutamate-1-semialdehyde 2,1-aminomutase